MKKSITLKYKMIISGLVAVVIPFFIAGIIIYFQLSSSLLQMAKEQSVHVAKDIAALIDARLLQEIKLASSIAADPDIIDASKSGDYREAQSELKKVYERIGRAFFTIFLTDKYGIARADAFFNQQIGLDLSDRDYFQKAKEGKTSVSGPLHPRGTATPGSTIIVVCAPIQEKNNFYGIVCLAFNTVFIKDILSQKKIGRKGYGYLIDAEGLVLVHPRNELNLNFRLLDQPGTEELKKIIMGKKTGTATFTIDGYENIVGLSGMELTGWIAVFSQSHEEIMSPVKKILSAISISGVIFLSITILIIIFFSSKISYPIHKVMEMTKQVTKHSTEIILQIGLDRKILFTNPAFEKLTGFKQEQIKGTELEINALNNTPSSAIWDSLETGIPWSGRIALNGSSPESIILDVLLVPLIDDRSTVQGYLEIGRDITAELMFEKRLQQAQKLEAIGTLAGGIAHDFNNILSGIFGFAELSLIKKDSASETEKYIRQIISAAERARDLVRQILTFSRKTEVELRPLLPGIVLKEAVKLLRASIPATINIETKIVGSSAILAEPTQIHQVVMNLFTNAVHSIGEKKGTIKLELEDYFVDEDFTRTHPNIKKGKHVMLRVSDTGHGIEQDTLDHIFEPFFTTKPSGQGTGLGLSVVHGIIKNLNGVITVYSEIGKGTVFNIFIPCLETDDSPLPMGDLPVKTGTERIVVVDDEIAITTTMHHILTNLGYTVTVFTDSLDALTAIKTNPDNFDLVITDYSMPQMSGIEVAKSLKDNGITIPVILTSGYLAQNTEMAARNTGISELIIKPINTYQLTDAIRRVLGGSE